MPHCATKNGNHANSGRGVPLAIYVAILSEGQFNAEYQQNSRWGTVTPGRARALAFFRRNSPWSVGQRHRSFRQIQAPSSPLPPPPCRRLRGLCCRAAPGATPMPRSPRLPAGHSFSGMASFYGNESGSKTASGQRFKPERHDLRPPLAAVRHQNWRVTHGGPERRRHRQ